MKKGILLATLLILGIGCSATAQTIHKESGTISISMSATEFLPADRIIFTVNLNAEEKTPRQAYQKHKKQEELLASLLKEFDIDEKDIKFQPIRVDKMYRNNRSDMYSRTNQQVSVTFDDFDIYEEIQLTLIENNFDSFNGSFSSSKVDEGKERALMKAIEAARSRAQTIADASGIEIGTIYSINYAEHSVQPVQRGMMELQVMADSAPSLMDFDQVVSVTSNISIQFNIAD